MSKRLMPEWNVRTGSYEENCFSCRKNGDSLHTGNYVGQPTNTSPALETYYFYFWQIACVQLADATLTFGLGAYSIRWIWCEREIRVR